MDPRGQVPYLTVGAADSIKQDSIFCLLLLAASWKRQPRLRGTRREWVDGQNQTVVDGAAQSGNRVRDEEKDLKRGSEPWEEFSQVTHSGSLVLRLDSFPFAPSRAVVLSLGSLEALHIFG